MASEIVHDADAALTAQLQLAMEVEARAGLVAPLFYKEVRITSPSKAYKVSIHPTTTDAAAITDGTAMSNTGINPTSQTATAAMVGLKGVLTDLSIKGSLLNEAESFANFGRALINKMDADGCNLLDNFSTVVGTSGADLTIANFLTAVYDLEEAGEMSNLVSVQDPIQVHNLRSEIVASAAPIYSGGDSGPLGGFLTSGVGSGAFKGTLFNVPIYATNNAYDDATDKWGAVFSAQRALLWAWMWEPMAESIRAPEYPGYTISVHASYGLVEVFDLAGVSLRTGRT
jgi:hypothetical protein